MFKTMLFTAVLCGTFYLSQSASVSASIASRLVRLTQPIVESMTKYMGTARGMAPRVTKTFRMPAVRQAVPKPTASRKGLLRIGNLKRKIPGTRNMSTRPNDLTFTGRRPVPNNNYYHGGSTSGRKIPQGPINHLKKNLTTKPNGYWHGSTKPGPKIHANANGYHHGKPLPVPIPKESAGLSLTLNNALFWWMPVLAPIAPMTVAGAAKLTKDSDSDESPESDEPSASPEAERETPQKSSDIGRKEKSRQSSDNQDRYLERLMMEFQ